MSKRDVNESTFYAKRAMAQAEINEFEEFMRKPDKTLDEYREGISRYFADSEWIRVFLDLINWVEETEVELSDGTKKKIDINKSKVFQKAWREIAYWQHNKAIRKTNDAVTIIASMLGGKYEKRQKRFKELRHYYGIS